MVLFGSGGIMLIRRILWRYGMAILLVCLATVLSVWRLQELQYMRGIFFFAAIVISSWLGGLGPGLFATLLASLSIDYYLLPPFHSITSFREDFLQTTLFMGLAALVAWLTTKRRSAEVRLREADRHKDEFLSVLAHELRTPLSMIANAASILKLEPANAEIVRRQQRMIERQARYMGSLLGDLLDITRIAQGKIRMEVGRVELGQIIENAVAQTRHQLEAHEHQLSVERPPAPVWIDGDPTRLEQVVVNLLNNAIKYTDNRGRISLSLTTQDGDELTPAGTAVLCVRDNGIGIPSELLPKIFSLYGQADAALKRSKGGLGIGLALVRNLVTLHGGSIEAHSAGPGQGSEFTVRLPLCACALKESQVA
jgi:signal transduction histidine kinase